MRCAPALMLLAACGPSPQPLPPPIIVRSALSITEAAPMTLVVRGDAGAVTHDADSIEIIDAVSFAVVNVVVASDGSFGATLPAGITDPLRLQAFAHDRRSIPVDVIADPGSPVGAVIDPPRIGCAVLEPPLSLDLPATVVGQVSSADAIVRNDCPGILAVDEAVLQTDPTWEVIDSIPADLAPGGQTSITVLRNPPAAGETRNYLRIRLVDAVQTELRLLTVHLTVQ